MEQILTYSLSGTCDDAKVIVNSLTDLGNAACARHYGNTGLFAGKYEMTEKEYKQLNEDVKNTIFAFAADRAGCKDMYDFSKKEDIVRAFSMNKNFESIYNSIVVEAINNIIVGADAPALMNLCNVKTVGLGDSYTMEIEPKGLPIAQRNSYMSNITLLEGSTKQAITITPKVYSLGVQVDWLRVVANGFDFGKEIAKVAMGLLYAQYKLVAGLIFSSTLVTGTPFYSATYSASVITTMIADLEAVNGGGSVKAYGTLPAFNAASATATTNLGFMLQDEYVKEGYIGRANGIDNIVLPQVTDLSAPYTTANKPILLPNDMIVLLSDVGNKPCTLVRENYVNVQAHDENEGSLRKRDYAYFMAFDAAIATAANYGVVKVA